MSSQILVRSTRSKSGSKLGSTGPRSPTPNTGKGYLAASTRLSPALSSALPVRKVNKTTKETNKGPNGKQVRTIPPPKQGTLNGKNTQHNSNKIVSKTTPGRTQGHTQSRSDDSLGDNTGILHQSQQADPDVMLTTSQQTTSDALDLSLDPASLYKEDPGKTLMLVLTELREIKTQMVKLNSMEATTAALAEQLGGALKKTEELEKTVSGNSAKLNKLGEEVIALNAKMGKQQKALSGFKSMKEEIAKTSAETISQMNGLIDEQRQQVDSFNSGTKQLKEDIIAEMDKRTEKRIKEIENNSGNNKLKEDILAEMDRRWDKKMEKIDNDSHCQKLKEQASNNRLNLVILGLEEIAHQSTTQVVKDFLADSLGLNRIEIRDARRLGSNAESGNNYVRPIVVNFRKLAHRNLIWRKRGEAKNKNNDKIRIQADLPKELREGMQSLYRITRAASKIEGFESAKVRNYQLELKGEIFQITDLEKLPVQLRPSTLAAPKSETHLAFFSRHTVLSNHYPSKFTIKGTLFHSMEQLLALRRAELSGDQDLIEKAKNASEPVQAKHILNALKENHQQEWDQRVEKVALEGLRAKVRQNRHIRDYLCDTKHLILGEASKNARWGIGMDLSDPDVLDHTKWSQTGNLLGRLLMEVRQECLKEKRKPNK